MKILERGISKVVGLYRMKPGKKFGFVIPDNQRIWIRIYLYRLKNQEEQWTDIKL